MIIINDAIRKMEYLLFVPRKQFNNDADLNKKIAELEIDLEALEFTELRTLAAIAEGGHPGAESSILKIRGTEIQQRLTELFVEAAGQYILPYEGPDAVSYTHLTLPTNREV